MSHLLRWKRKFANAFRGLSLGTKGQDSFLVHLPMALLVMLLGAFVRCSLLELALLLLCIGLVLTAELFNSALERLAKGLCPEQNTDVGAALDIASGAVLAASFFAALVGAIVLISRILKMIQFSF